MLFGPVPISTARGAILAHSQRVEGQMLRKGRVLSDADLTALAHAGIGEITVARLETGDIAEDEAATRIAKASAGTGVRVGAAFTGRANLYAETRGIAEVDPAKIAAINAVDESITIATLPPFARVEPRQMLATIKIIPFAAPRIAIEKVEQLFATGAAVRVAPFAAKRVALISTTLPDTRPQVLDKNVRAIDARLKSLGSSLVFERRVLHDDDAVAGAIRDALDAVTDPVLVFGASAITDRRDVIPSAILQVGGTIERFGLPVDPGNLLLIGYAARGATIIGLPGCARSPKRNGFDFVLERVLADIPVNESDFAQMGLGGLLTEIATRPQPRDPAPTEIPRAPNVAAVVLAAGLATRMGHNKLLADVSGKPLVRRIVEAATLSHANRVIVVTGNESRNIERALSDLPVSIVQNENFREGLSSSLKVGIRAVPDDFDAAIVLLGDMPGVSAEMIDRLIAAFNPEEGRAICVASHGGKRGNPVLWSQRFFPEILALEGDIGAKHLIAANDEAVCEVEAGDDGPLVDIDTPEALTAWTARQK